LDTPSHNKLEPSTNRPAAASKSLILFTVSFTLLFTSYMFASLNIALPSVNLEFQADAILLSWLSTAIVLGSAVLTIPFGRLADIVGLRKIVIIGIIIHTLAAASGYFSVSISMLIASRVLQGVSAAMIIGNIMALLSIVFPTGERGRALGLASSAVYVGTTVSPLLSGTITEHFGWRSIFLVSVIAGFIMLVFFLWKIKGEWRGSKGEPMDFLGSAFFIISILLLMFGLSQVSSGLPYWQIALCLAMGMGILWVFLRWEAKTPFPILNFNLFKKNRVFILSNISAFINYSSIYPISFLLSLYLQLVKGFNPETASLIMVGQPIIQVIMAPMAGRLSDKIEPRIVSSVGMGFCSIGLFLFSFISLDTPVLAIVVLLMVEGLGFGLFAAPNTNAAMSSVEHKHYGVASALINTMRNTGQIFSMAIVMIILSIVVGKVVITAEYHPAFVQTCKIVFIFFGGLSLAGVFTSLARGKMYQN
jgi:EmrB/QacA subfamily drug resistance transporter